VSAQVLAQLPRDARRVVVRGTSGSGKTTLARRIAASLGVPHVELDSIFHQPGWTELPDDEFRRRVDALSDDVGWAICGNYRQVAGTILDRADTLVIYDLPRRTVMRRVVTRTLRRAVRREELWNGNKEQWRNLVSRDPERSIIAWAWTTHAERHAEMRSLAASPPRGRLRVVYVGSIDDERLLYAGLGEPVRKDG
jgi:adenylate kinase family enzyme